MKSNSFYPVLSESEKALPFYVKSVGINHIQHGIYRKKGTDTYQLLLSKNEGGNVVLNGKTMPLHCGDMLFLDKHTVHNYTNTTPIWITDWIVFDGNGVPLTKKFKSGIYHPENFNEIASVIENIVKIKNSINWLRDSSVLLYKLILLCDGSITGNIGKALIIRLSPAVSYIEQNYNKNISLSEISSTINVTNEHLCSMFHSAYGMRPFEFITKFRIQKSKELLVNKPNLSVQCIGKSCGFNSPSYYTMKFKQLESITPMQFRLYNTAIKN